MKPERPERFVTNDCSARDNVFVNQWWCCDTPIRLAHTLGTAQRTLPLSGRSLLPLPRLNSYLLTYSPHNADPQSFY